MKAKRILLLALIFALLLATSVSSGAAAKNAVVPFKGFYVTYPQNVGMDASGCNLMLIPAVGEATHLGASTWQSDIKNCPGTWVQTGTSTFTADNGDLLYMSFVGTFSISLGVASFSGEYTITGGSGRFEGAGGTGTYWGSARLAPGSTGELSFDGMLEK